MTKSEIRNPNNKTTQKTMPVLKFKRFNKPQTLKRIGRGLLAQFLARFHAELAARSLALPQAELPDADYFQTLAGLLMAPEALPDGFNEALFAIDEMSTPRGQDLLQAIPEWSGLQLRLHPDSSPEEIALQVWLAAPALLARTHRGKQTTRIEVYPLEDEFWFLVRHGDTYTRTPKVDQQKTEIIHFRPERDDVIVYSPARAEIGLNARPKGA